MDEVEGEGGSSSTRSRRALGFDGLTRPELLARAGELRRFAESVFDAYAATKEPLERAEHYGLNALARGAFMLGREQLAVDVFAAMRNRGASRPSTIGRSLPLSRSRTALPVRPPTTTVYASSYRAQGLTSASCLPPRRS